MVAGAGCATNERHRSGALPFAPGAQESSGADSAANRVDALSKLNLLLGLGVLTEEQYDSEYARLTKGSPATAGAQMQLGPVQLLVIPFAKGTFDVTILEELRSLREQDTRMLDLLFVVKDEMGNIAQLDQSGLTVQEAAEFGDLVGALFDLRDGEEDASSTDAAADETLDDRNGLPHDDVDTWFLADAIPTGGAAVIALVEHQWAIALRDAIMLAGGHDLIDSWLHPEDLRATGAEGA